METSMTTPRKAFVVCVGLAWLAWAFLIAAVSAATVEGLALKRRGIFQEIDIEDFSSVTWATVAVLFVTLTLATVAAVQGVLRGKTRLLYSFARLITFFLAAIIGWMGNEADLWAGWNRETRRVSTSEDLADAPDDFDPSAFDKIDRIAGVNLAAFILVILSLFGMGTALVFVLSEADGGAAPAKTGAAGDAKTYVHGLSDAARIDESAVSAIGYV